MARLINDSGVLGDAIKVTNKTVADVPFDKVIEAINVIQTRMGITGTTAKEAGRTIAGSVGSMKAAWTNLVTGLADGNADIVQLVDNLVTTIVGDGTENNLGVLGNIMPAVKTALNGASKLVQGLLPKIVQEIPSIINDNLPVLAEAAISIIRSLADGIIQNQEMLMMETAFETITYLANSFITMLPQIVQLGLDLIVSLANGIANSLDTLIPTIIDVILKIVDTLTSPAQLQNLLNAALLLVTELAYGLMDAIPQLVDACIQIILNIVEFLTSPENIGKLLVASVELVLALATGLINAIPQLLTAGGKLIKTLIDNFKETDWLQVGEDIVNGIWDGLKRMWESLKDWFSNAWNDLVGGVKDLLGIHSPSRVFADIGKNMALGVGEGWDDEFGSIKDDIDKSMNFDDASMRINASVKKTANTTGNGLAGVGGVSIVQNIYSEAKTAADLMQEALYQQERAVLIGV